MTLPTIPGLGSNPNAGVPTTSVGADGLPSYGDLNPNAQTAGSPSVPGSTAWWQQQLGALYGQSVLIGIAPNGQPHGGKQADQNENNGTLPAPTGNRTQTTQDLFKQIMALSTKSPQQFMQMQGLLYDSGAYGATPRTSVHWGQWTSDTASALKEALSNYEAVGPASGSPVTWTEYLQQAASQGRINQAQGGVGGAGAGTASQVSLTDPAQLTSIAQQAFQESLDRAATPDEISKFVSAFQSQQTAAQTSTGASVTAPDATAQAEQFAQGADPAGFQQHNVQAYSNELLNMFLPSGSNVASFTPVPKV